MKQVVAAVAWDDGCYREPIQQQRSLRCDAAAQLNSALGFMKFEGYEGLEQVPYRPSGTCRLATPHAV